MRIGSTKFLMKEIINATKLFSNCQYLSIQSFPRVSLQSLCLLLYQGPQKDPKNGWARTRALSECNLGVRGSQPPENFFRIKLIGLLENALFIITRRNYHHHSEWFKYSISCAKSLNTNAAIAARSSNLSCSYA